ncbi:iron complex outermembrane receptor protein [Dysgonomonas sp. PH5-45]|uniref:TonB-dependent receptor n=1 Tax=unclassified Dysgonomonas TaxID=2630389 RepID=UPI002475C972|nr:MULTISPECIES: TonB-dependent receptor [unclassified Dysgonomonas]MDH6355958.1 iron complex outermembrane receptor protein [Dysgonomonas sp. PH5-45]MDH6388841.1 iron complex outermembrane receptor protein [Dysgonomonas sp. PH5-37]
MKKILLCISAILFLNAALANTKDASEQKNDTLYTELKSDVIILSSTKETNSLKSLPAAVSFLSQKNLDMIQASSLKEISAYVPNFFVSDYGSKMSAPLYIRGVGARTGTQTVSMYIDNVPYFNPSTFDTELYDIQRVEVLRGTQSTLYGRNSMGGIMNVYTYSPLTYEGKTATVSAGNHGLFSANLSHYKRVSNTFGFSASVYYKRTDGFFKNAYNGRRADDGDNAGGRVKLVWNWTPSLEAIFTSSFDYTNQNAYPYMNINNNKVDINGDNSYIRRVYTNGLALKYTADKYIINSTTAYQYLNDNMHMDQDYSSASIFGLNQRQWENSLSQEVTIKSNTNSNYQWSFGAFGFYDHLKMKSPVHMYEEGIGLLVQPALDRLNQNPNIPVTINITSPEIDFNCDFRTQTSGAAAFHQSTFNNLFNVKGLSFTAGLRLDYEKSQLKYNTNTGVNFDLGWKNAPRPTLNYRADTVMNGKADVDYLELLPKGVIKYAFNDGSYLYGSVSRGYKSGGHNVSLFADVLKDALQPAMMNAVGMGSAPGTDPKDLITFKPEYSWNYEIGGQVYFLDDALALNAALYYIDIKDVQITQFAESGAGRGTTNAGKASSKGFEVGAKVRPCKGFYLFANYGLADAKFKDYRVDDNTNYKDNHIPFAPQQTFSVGTSITYDMKKNSIIDKIQFDASYSGVGRIYWTEENNLYQRSYGTLNARLGFVKKAFTVELWGKNLLDKDYQAFYFESMGNSFVQKGKPIQFGATLKLKL